MTDLSRALRAFCLAIIMLVGVSVPSAAAALPGEVLSKSEGASDDAYWIWPIDGARVVLEPFRAPAHAYGAGHRGIDIAATPGAVVMAPAAGIVAFRGTVVDRPLLTIAHADGLVTTFEPLESTLDPGDAVAEGDPIGTVSAGGHTPPGAMHLGVRRDGAYINPLLLFGGVPRAVLLPCCDAR